MATTEIKNIEQEPWYERLFLPSYRIGEAARYAGAHPNTVSAWHRSGSPVLTGRESRTDLSYMQLVEVAFVAFFRHQGIPLQRIRKARQYLSEQFACEHPFARYQFKTEGMDILMRHNKALGLGNIEQLVVANKYGQLAWVDLLGNKFMEFDYDYEIALRWHPAGRESQVIIDPRHRWGWPMVQGLETWAIKGSYDAGETFEEISRDYDVTIEGVLDALRFEGVPEALLV